MAYDVLMCRYDTSTSDQRASAERDRAGATSDQTTAASTDITGSGADKTDTDKPAPRRQQLEKECDDVSAGQRAPPISVGAGLIGDLGL